MIENLEAIPPKCFDWSKKDIYTFSTISHLLLSLKPSINKSITPYELVIFDWSKLLGSEDTPVILTY